MGITSYIKERDSSSPGAGSGDQIEYGVLLYPSFR